MTCDAFLLTFMLVNLCLFLPVSILNGFYKQTSPNSILPKTKAMHTSQKTSPILSSPCADQQIELNVGNPGAIRPYPFVFRFSNLTYSVKIRPKLRCPSPVRKNASENCQKRKTLLKGISGEAKEGEIMGILGPSGSGKSTLIDALAGRISRERLEGSVTLNGHDVLTPDTGFLTSISAYVMQQDSPLFPTLTVEETLMFTAELRLPRTLSKLKKRTRVEELITQLKLRDAANTMIGDVSTGERKRVSIGIDIIHNPIILFLDEPTSGLDSSNALLMVSVLKGIARAGGIVVLTIHQPSSRVLTLVDRLIFLSGGCMVYSGLVSQLSELFTAYNHPILECENRAEFALDLISKLEDSDSPDAIQPWKPRETLKDAVNVTVSRGKILTSVGIGTIQPFVNPIWVEVYILTKRSLINSARMPGSFVFRLGAVLLSSVMLGTIFWRLDDSPTGTRERLGFIASAVTTSIFICAEAIPHFIEERSIFIKETTYRAYRKSSYALAHCITSLPLLTLLALTFSVVTFWAVGLAGGLSWFFAFILGSFWAGHSLVTFVSAVVPNAMVGYLVVVTLLAQFMLFSGFFITRDQIPRFWIWFHYMSLVKYPYQGIMWGEFGNRNRCFVRGSQIFEVIPLTKGAPESVKLRVLKCISSSLGDNVSGSSCLMTGYNLLEQQGVTDLSRLACLGILFALGLFFRILFYFGLLFGNKSKRT